MRHNFIQHGGKVNYSAGMVRSRQILGWFQFKILSRSNPVARARITDMFFLWSWQVYSAVGLCLTFGILSALLTEKLHWPGGWGGRRGKARSIYFCKLLLKNYKKVKFGGRTIFSLLLILDITNQREGQLFFFCPMIIGNTWKMRIHCVHELMKKNHGDMLTKNEAQQLQSKITIYLEILNTVNLVHFLGLSGALSCTHGNQL